jgi:uncharacterized membrane protein YphA (DoxX/SURF4 family)
LKSKDNELVVYIIILHVILYGLATIFIWSGITKSIHLEDFVSTLNQDYGFSIETSSLITLILPSLEISVGIMLLIRSTRLFGFTYTFMLSLVFLCASARLPELARCGCFGKGPPHSHVLIVTWEMILLLGSGLGLWLDRFLERKEKCRLI